MAYSVTLSTLTAQVLDYVESDNDELIAGLPDMIARAQDMIQRDLALERWRKQYPGNLTAGSATFTPQGQWLKVLSIELIDEGVFPEKRTIDYVRMCGRPSGVPRYWADRNETQIQLVPVPAENYNVEFEVLEKLPALTTQSPTNWITDNLADLLFYATLVQAEAYLVGTERAAEFLMAYNGTLDAVRADLTGTKRKEYKPTRPAPAVPKPETAEP